MKKIREKMRDFLMKSYRADRFALRNTPEWNYDGGNYQETIIDSKIEALIKDGYFGISHFDAVDGNGGFWNDAFVQVYRFKSNEKN